MVQKNLCYPDPEPSEAQKNLCYLRNLCETKITPRQPNYQLSISFAEVWARLGIVQVHLTLLSLLQTLSTVNCQLASMNRCCRGPNSSMRRSRRKGHQRRTFSLRFMSMSMTCTMSSCSGA